MVHATNHPVKIQTFAYAFIGAQSYAKNLAEYDRSLNANSKCYVFYLTRFTLYGLLAASFAHYLKAKSAPDKVWFHLLVVIAAWKDRYDQYSGL